MICISENLWIGDSTDGRTHGKIPVNGVLNVAQDLWLRGIWPGVEYMKVGLIDGPGNLPSAYCTAVLALHVLLRRGSVLVCCHTGSRSLAVSLIYLILNRGKTSSHPTFFNYWVTWDKMLEELLTKLQFSLPVVHQAHKDAFDKLPLATLELLTQD